ncbi:EEF1A lysine methyltransferase 4 isoform X2 [Anomaloglossus baeobatrachus]|uniref:EEF1A lysine methyltransferase 4 isoform X2 n=1 Tax=Anomaloglossus baeobatrachus TaxID=238106 RepID=UPI003F500C4C
MSGRYKKLEYWDSRYEEEERLLTGGHEWFGAYRDFAHLVRRELRPRTAGLVLGCGTSSLSAELYNEGVRPLVSIDYSPVCIKEMAQRNANVPDMSWMVMDARHLQFPDGTFDLVIEKGTLDAMMVDERDPWRVTQDTITLVDQVLSEREGQRCAVAHSFAFGEHCGTSLWITVPVTRTYRWHTDDTQGPIGELTKDPCIPLQKMADLGPGDGCLPSSTRYFVPRR